MEDSTCVLHGDMRENENGSEKKQLEIQVQGAWLEEENLLKKGGRMREIGNKNVPVPENAVTSR